MSCEDFRPFVGAYVDGEFDERETGEFEAHLQTCEECQRRVERRAEVKSALQESTAEVEAPEGLRERIVEELHRVDDEESGERAPEAEGRRASQLAYAAAAVPLAAGIALVAWLVPAMTVQPVESEELPIVEQTVEWHQRDFPVEVEGSDSAEISQWFGGKVDFPVRLPAFDGERIELVGGRIANVQNRRAAYISYRADGEELSVMLFRGEGLKVPGERVRDVAGREVAVLNNDGYGVAVMQNDGITYTMTSDLGQNELVELVSSSLEP